MKHHYKKILAASLLAIVVLFFFFTDTATSAIIPNPKNHAIIIPTSSSIMFSLPHLRILPLGDSITYGFLSTTGNGYRETLYNLLNVTFPSISYIGSQHSGNMSNDSNEGHPGYLIHDIAKKALPSLVEQPNIVLLMAGTNDMALPYMPEDAPWRLGALIDFVLLSCPFSAIVVAQLGPVTIPPGAQTLINNFNSQVPEIVASRQRAGKKVLTIDMSRRVKPENLRDGVHPTDTGYELIAQTWFEGIQQAAKYGWIWEPIPVTRQGNPTSVLGPDGYEMPQRPVVEDGRICEICV